MNVPEISKFQYHPFTISSSPEDPYISVHIRQAGDWTRALGERLGCTQNLALQLTDEAKVGREKSELGYGDSDFIDVTGINPNVSLPTLRIDGPYGAPAEDVFKKEVAVLIGTGIGVTPFAATLKHIM
jgi:NADPH oxidase